MNVNGDDGDFQMFLIEMEVECFVAVHTNQDNFECMVQPFSKSNYDNKQGRSVSDSTLSTTYNS